MASLENAEQAEGGIAEVSGDLRERLTHSASAGTPTERAIAAYLLTNLQSLPFETAASVAQKIGVSEASIGRFCRGIGYRHLKDLKGSLQSDLGDRAWLIGDRLRDFSPAQPDQQSGTRQRAGAGNGGIGRGL